MGTFIETIEEIDSILSFVIHSIECSGKLSLFITMIQSE